MKEAGFAANPRREREMIKPGEFLSCRGEVCILNVSKLAEIWRQQTRCIL
jgi:hypothetical protein